MPSSSASLVAVTSVFKSSSSRPSSTRDATLAGAAVNHSTTIWSTVSPSDRCTP